MRAPLLRRFLVVVAGMLGARSYTCGCCRPWSRKGTFLKRIQFSGEVKQPRSWSARTPRATSPFHCTSFSRSTSPCLRTAKRSRSETAAAGGRYSKGGQHPDRRCKWRGLRARNPKLLGQGAARPLVRCEESRMPCRMRCLLFWVCAVPRC